MTYKKHNFEDGKVLYASALNEMEEQIIKNSGEPEWNFTSDYQSELEKVIDAVKDIQNNNKLHTIEFIMFSDTHRENINDHPEFYRMMQAINYLTHKLDIKFVVNLGDNYNGYPVENADYGKGHEGVFEELVKVLSKLNSPFININGNHDSVPHIYKRNWITNLSNAVFDNVGSWFYLDDDFHNIRFIVLDCQDWDGDALNWTTVSSTKGYADRSYEQLSWLAHTALKTKKKIVFLQHQSMEETGYYLVHPTKPTSDGRYYFTTNIIDAFEQGTNGSISYDSNRNIDFDFSSQGQGTVLCNFSGHTHGDAFYNASYSYPSGFTSSINEIAIDDALCSTGTHAGTANTKTLNTVNEIVFDVVSIDLLSNIVTCYRFGAGKDRICTLNGSMTTK